MDGDEKRIFERLSSLPKGKIIRSVMISITDISEYILDKDITLASVLTKDGPGFSGSMLEQYRQRWLAQHIGVMAESRKSVPIYHKH